MRYTSKNAFVLLTALSVMALATIACSSSSQPEKVEAVGAQPAVASVTPIPTATAVATSTVTEPTATPEDTRTVRPVPEALLNPTSTNKTLEIAILANAWNDYLDGGTLISLDGEHTMEMCTFDANYWIRATGSIGSSNALGARLMFESPEWGWPGPGLNIMETQRSNYVTGYLLEIHDGIPTLVWNPDATHGFVYDEARWLEPAVNNIQFEVIEDGLDCSFKERLIFVETYPPGWN